MENPLAFKKKSCILQNLMEKKSGHTDKINTRGMSAVWAHWLYVTLDPIF